MFKISEKYLLVTDTNMVKFMRDNIFLISYVNYALITN